MLACSSDTNKDIFCVSFSFQSFVSLDQSSCAVYLMWYSLLPFSGNLLLLFFLRNDFKILAKSREGITFSSLTIQFSKSVLAFSKRHICFLVCWGKWILWNFKKYISKNKRIYFCLRKKRNVLLNKEVMFFTQFSNLISWHRSFIVLSKDVSSIFSYFCCSLTPVPEKQNTSLLLLIKVTKVQQNKWKKKPELSDECGH